MAGKNIKAADAPDVIQIFGRLTLAEIDAEISRLGSEIEPLQRAIESLRILRRAVDVRENGKPEKKQRQPRAKPLTQPGQQINAGGGRAVSWKEKIVAYLKQKGPTKSGIIAADMGTAQATVSQIVNKFDMTFKRDLDGAWGLK